jgi:hypothetical protein
LVFVVGRGFIAFHRLLNIHRPYRTEENPFRVDGILGGWWSLAEPEKQSIQIGKPNR